MGWCRALRWGVCARVGIFLSQVCQGGTRHDLLFLPLPIHPGKTSYCSHSPAAERYFPESAAWGLNSCCLASLRSDTLLWVGSGLQFIKCPFCISYSASAQMKVLEENPLLEVFQHPPQLILVEMEKGLFTGTAHLADEKGSGGYFHQGGGKDQMGVRWHRSSRHQSAQLQLGEDVFLHPLYWGRLIPNLISSFSSFTGWICVSMKHESYPLKEVRNTVIDACFMEIIWERQVWEPWLKSFSISVIFSFLHVSFEWRRWNYCFVWTSAVPKTMKDFW